MGLLCTTFMLLKPLFLLGQEITSPSKLEPSAFSWSLKNHTHRRINFSQRSYGVREEIRLKTGRIFEATAVETYGFFVRYK
jgi:hypothetical protein